MEEKHFGAYQHFHGCDLSLLSDSVNVFNYCYQLAEEPHEMNVILILEIAMKQNTRCLSLPFAALFPFHQGGRLPHQSGILGKGFDINQFCQSNQLYRFQVICFLSKETVY